MTLKKLAINKFQISHKSSIITSPATEGRNSTSTSKLQNSLPCIINGCVTNRSHFVSQTEELRTSEVAMHPSKNFYIKFGDQGEVTQWHSK